MPLKYENYKEYMENKDNFSIGVIKKMVSIILAALITISGLIITESDKLSVIGVALFIVGLFLFFWTVFLYHPNINE